MMYRIYSLSHDNVPFYIGITSTSLKDRLCNHLGMLKSGYDYPVYKYINNNSFGKSKMYTTEELYQLFINQNTK